MAQNSRKFRSLLDTYNVSAVFVGHYHSRIGKDSNPRPNNVSYGNIPIIYCGAPTYNRYLSVKFDAANQKMVVTQINSTGGNAAASMGSVKTYTLKAN